jgi:hypothetical protein
MIVADEEGETHFVPLEIPGPVDTSTGIRRLRLPAFESPMVNIGETLERRPTQEWHPAPRRQFVVCLRGAFEIMTRDGERRHFEAGDFVLVTDLDGKGHTYEDVGEERMITLQIAVPDDWEWPTS